MTYWFRCLFYFCYVVSMYAILIFLRRYGNANGGRLFLSRRIFESRRADRYSVDMAVWFRRGPPFAAKLIRVDVCGMDIYKWILNIVIKNREIGYVHRDRSKWENCKKKSILPKYLSFMKNIILYRYYADLLHILWHP